MFKFMQLLAGYIDGAGSGVNGSDLESGLIGGVWNNFFKYFKIIMPVLIAVVLVIGMVYAIIIGVQFAKAEDTDQRDKAKSRLINVIIGVVVAAILMIVIWAVIPTILGGKLFGA